MPGVVVHTCNPSIWETEVGELPWTWVQPRLHSEYPARQGYQNKIHLDKWKQTVILGKAIISVETKMLSSCTDNLAKPGAPVRPVAAHQNHLGALETCHWWGASQDPDFPGQSAWTLHISFISQVMLSGSQDGEGICFPERTEAYK